MTTADRTTRRVYSAEQLHKLRGSFSAPKLREAIEEHDREDAELVKGTLLPLPLPPPLPPPPQSLPPSLPVSPRLTATLPEVEPLFSNALGTTRCTPRSHSSFFHIRPVPEYHTGTIIIVTMHHVETTTRT